MSAQTREMLMLILQYLKEEGFQDTAHALERESNLQFNWLHFEDLILSGKFDAAETYLGGFVRLQDNRFSMEMYFALYKQRYLEALDRKDHYKALDALKDLRAFETINREIYLELAALLPMDDFRQDRRLTTYGDTQSARILTAKELRRLADLNPVTATKLQSLPSLPPSSLKQLLQQSASRHGGPGSAEVGVLLPQLYEHFSNIPTAAGARGYSGGILVQPPPAGPMLFHMPMNSGPPSTMMLHPELQAKMSVQRPENVDSQMSMAMNLPLHSQAFPLASNMPLPVAGTKHGRHGESLDGPSQAVPSGAGSSLSKHRISDSLNSRPVPAPDELPALPVATFPTVISAADFHPSHSTLLLVGTPSGSIELWCLSPPERLMTLKPTSALVVENTPVKRVAWTKNGNGAGIAFGPCHGRGVLHMYTSGFFNAEARREVDAHAGGVNDVAFADVDGVTVALTGGHDGEVKGWNFLTGQILYRWKGHSGAVHCVHPHVKSHIPVVMSSGDDGYLRTWMYDSRECYNQCMVQGSVITSIVHTSNGARMFSCGTARTSGIRGGALDSTLVEWNEDMSRVNAVFQGFQGTVRGTSRIVLAKDKYLMVGDGGIVKVWDVDRPMEAAALPLHPELPESPVVALDATSNLMLVGAVASVMLLASPSGRQLLAAGPSAVLPGAIVSGPATTSPRQPSGAPPPKRSATQAAPAPSGQQAAPPNKPVLSVTRKPHASNKPNPPALLLSTTQPIAIHRAPSIRPEPATISSHQSISATWIDGGAPASNVAADFVRFLGDGGEGDRILAISRDGSPKLWTATPPATTGPEHAVSNHWVLTKELAAVAATASTTAASIDISNNGSYCLVSVGGSVSLYSLGPLWLLMAVPPSNPVTRASVFDPSNNNVIVLGLDDGSVAVHHLQQSAILDQLHLHNSPVNRLAFSPGVKAADGSEGPSSLLATSSIDGSVSVCSRRGDHTFEQMTVFRSEGNAVGHALVFLAFHPTVRGRLIAASKNQLVSYDLNTETESPVVKISQIHPSGSGHSAHITTAGFLDKGSSLLVAFSDGALALLESSSLLATAWWLGRLVDRHGNGMHVTSVAPLPGPSESFVLGLSNGRVVVWQPAAAAGGSWTAAASLGGKAAKGDPVVIAQSGAVSPKRTQEASAPSKQVNAGTAPSSLTALAGPPSHVVTTAVAVPSAARAAAQPVHGPQQDKPDHSNSSQTSPHPSGTSPDSTEHDAAAEVTGTPAQSHTPSASEGTDGSQSSLARH